MIRQTKTKIYDTDNATVVKKITSGYFGDPAGYETTMYRTADGAYFLYANGGKDSAYAKESITAYSKKRAEEWLKNN